MTKYEMKELIKLLGHLGKELVLMLEKLPSLDGYKYGYVTYLKIVELLDPYIKKNFKEEKEVWLKKKGEY